MYVSVCRKLRGSVELPLTQGRLHVSSSSAFAQRKKIPFVAVAALAQENKIDHGHANCDGLIAGLSCSPVRFQFTHSCLRLKLTLSLTYVSFNI